MSLIRLLEEEEYADQIEALDRKIREYTQAPVMTNYVKAGAYKPYFLKQSAEEHLYIMPSTKHLRRKVKEMLAVAVSMTVGCEYCITAHSGVLKRMFKLTDEDIVELALTQAHFNGLAGFEFVAGITPAGVIGPFQPLEAGALPLLGEIEDRLGLLPIYYQVMARDPRWLEQIWEREVGCLFEGNLDRFEKHFVALAVAASRGAAYSVGFQTEVLRGLGATDAQLWEAMRVIALFNHNTKYTEGLLLQPGVWRGDGKD
ncbi:MAG: carboxymuconolactone decarboxylase family protein [Anaerolineae bacterium]